MVQRPEDGPEFGAEAVGLGRTQAVGDHDALDHVGEYGTAGTIVEADRHHGTVGAAPDRAVDADEPWRTPEARPDEPSPTRLSGDRPGGGSKLDGGCDFHTPTMMTKGYVRVGRAAAGPMGQARSMPM